MAVSGMNIVRVRVKLKHDGPRWRTVGEVKGKRVSGVGSQYPSHYLGTWCIQHYYRACAHLRCQQSTELTPTGRFKWTRPMRWKTKSGFCACAITFQTCSTTSNEAWCSGSVSYGDDLSYELWRRIVCLKLNEYFQGTCWIYLKVSALKMKAGGFYKNMPSFVRKHLAFNYTFV